MLNLKKPPERLDIIRPVYGVRATDRRRWQPPIAGAQGFVNNQERRLFELLRFKSNSRIRYNAHRLVMNGVYYWVHTNMALVSALTACCDCLLITDTSWWCSEDYV